jgi:hypothetical protein
MLPLSLQHFNLDNHDGHELHEPVDVNPANAADTAAESFLQDLDYTSGEETSDFYVLGTKIRADSTNDCVQSEAAPGHVSASGSAGQTALPADRSALGSRPLRVVPFGPPPSVRGPPTVGTPGGLSATPSSATGSCILTNHLFSHTGVYTILCGG